MFYVTIVGVKLYFWLKFGCLKCKAEGKIISLLEMKSLILSTWIQIVIKPCFKVAFKDSLRCKSASVCALYYNLQQYGEYNICRKLS